MTGRPRGTPAACMIARDRRRERSLREVEVNGRFASVPLPLPQPDGVCPLRRLFVKEPGTCAWNDRQVRPGDVFYDIGAKVGLYAIMAGVRVGREDSSPASPRPRISPRWGTTSPPTTSPG